jgi:hypothetical protein
MFIFNSLYDYDVTCFSASVVDLASCQSVLHIDSTNCCRFVDDPRYTYKDCSRREENNGIAGLIPAEFSWEIHGYDLANRLCIDVAVILDEKFSIAQNLTYHTFVIFLFLVANSLSYL